MRNRHTYNAHDGVVEDCVAEQDADTILAALWRESRSPRSPRPSRGAPP